MNEAGTENRKRAIFISYRRDDAEGQAGRLFKDLTERFGEDSVFMDVADIEPGRDFRRVIDQQVASCGVLLAMIGKGWAGAKDESGRRRLDDPGDFVRLETAAALKRDIPVIPVLVQGAKMPKAEQLPADLSELAFRNGVELTHARWDSDVEVLIKALRPHLAAGAAAGEPAESGTTPAVRAEEPGGGRTLGGEPAGRGDGSGGAEPPRKTSFGLIAAAAIAAVAVAGGGYVAFDRYQQSALEKAEAEKAAARAELDKARAEAAAAKTAAENAAMKAEADVAKAEAAAARAAAEKAEAERVARDKAAEAERVARERAAEAERVAREKAEADRIAREQAEAERVAREKAVQADRAARERATEAERAARAGAAARQPSSPAAQTTQYEGVITIRDPCTNRTVTAKGITSLAIQATSAGIVVQMQFEGSGDGFTVKYRGTATFPERAASYDVPIRGAWGTSGRVPFPSQGVDRVLANPAGAPTGDRIQNLTGTCLR